MVAGDCAADVWRGKAREMEAAAGADFEANWMNLQRRRLQTCDGDSAAGSEPGAADQRVTELDTKSGRIRNSIKFNGHLEADRAENRIAFNTQRAEELAARRGSKRGT